MKNKKASSKEENYKLLMVVAFILLIILGGYFYLDKVRDLEKTIDRIQGVLPVTSNDSETKESLIDKKVLMNALSEEELDSNFGSIVKNVYGYDVEYRCEEYNDVDGCNKITAIVKPFDLK